MGTLTVRQIVMAGKNPISPVYETATVADTFPNDGQTFIHYKNEHGAETPIITVTSQQLCDQGVIDNVVSAAIPTSTGELMLGPFDRGRFNNAAGHVEVAASAATTLKVAVFSVKPA